MVSGNIWQHIANERGGHVSHYSTEKIANVTFADIHKQVSLNIPPASRKHAYIILTPLNPTFI